jgi:hypothetical protein
MPGERGESELLPLPPYDEEEPDRLPDPDDTRDPGDGETPAPDFE